MTASVLTGHIRYRAIEYARTTWSIIPTLAFPVMIAAFFIVPAAGSEPGAANYGLVAVLLLTFTMISMFAFGAGTAEDRRLPWDAYLRTVPVRPAVPVAARVVVGLGFAVVGSLPAVALIAARTAVDVPVGRWPMLAAAILAGATAMTLLGLSIGYALPFKAAIATANVLFLPMGFVGGIFLPLEIMPGWARAVGLATPVRPWVEVSLSAADGTPAAAGWWAALAAWVVVLGALALWAYRRDAVQRFR